MTRSKTLSLLSVVLVGSFVLTGCGDDDDNNNNNNNTNNNVRTIDCVDGLATLSGEYTQDIHLTADCNYLLEGGVFIGDDENSYTLTIDAGVQIFGDTASKSMLVVRRGSRIDAQGTAESPIVFTSAADPGSRASGDWGGVILNGRAVTNACGGTPGSCEVQGEGDTGTYGGDDDTYNCGTLRYVRIEFAGKLISPENELNGLALQACGSQTTLEYIQIHMGADDAIEFFGGTANFKYVLATGTSDDNLDWTDGWRGKGQFFVAQQYDGIGDQGIEADNNGESNDAEPRSFPTLSNLTLIGVPTGEKSDVGILLREGTGANIHNAIVLGFGEYCLDIDHDATFANAVTTANGTDLNGNLTIENTIMHGCAAMYDLGDPAPDADPFSVEEFFTTYNDGNSTDDPMLGAPYNTQSPDFVPGAGSPALTGGVTPSDSFFTSVTFRGGVDPANDWTTGWTTTATN